MRFHDFRDRWGDIYTKIEDVMLRRQSPENFIFMRPERKMTSPWTNRRLVEATNVLYAGHCLNERQNSERWLNRKKSTHS